MKIYSSMTTKPIRHERHGSGEQPACVGNSIGRPQHGRMATRTSKRSSQICKLCAGAFCLQKRMVNSRTKVQNVVRVAAGCSALRSKVNVEDRMHHLNPHYYYAFSVMWYPGTMFYAYIRHQVTQNSSGASN